MKPLYQTNPKMLQKATVIIVATLLISSFFTSCTVDELPSNSKKEILKETYLQRKDSIRNDSITTNTSTTTSGEDIDPIKLPPPPPPTNH